MATVDTFAPSLSRVPADPNLGSQIPAETKAQLKEKAQQFESFYIYQTLELMKSQNESKVMNGGVGEEMFRHQLNEELANNITQAGGFGIADKIYGELLRAQEGRMNANPGMYPQTGGQ